MAIERMASKAGSGIAILVSAGIVYEIIAAACSSPQTTEINFGKRGPTLMKWVYIGEGQAVIFVGLAALFDRKYAKEYILGGLLAGGIMHGSYMHAAYAGANSPEDGTED